MSPNGKDNYVIKDTYASDPQCILEILLNISEKLVRKIKKYPKSMVEYLDNEKYNGDIFIFRELKIKFFRHLSQKQKVTF